MKTNFKLFRNGNHYGRPTVNRRSKQRTVLYRLNQTSIYPLHPPHPRRGTDVGIVKSFFTKNHRKITNKWRKNHKMHKKCK